MPTPQNTALPTSAHQGTPDIPLEQIKNALLAADPTGQRMARVFRDTFDQLYDGERTGRFRVEQLFKTEKTHFGTLIEINLRREFDGVIGDGAKLDFAVAGYDIDCKFSFTKAWMLPPECFGELLLVCTASDAESTWSVGIVRATEEHRRTGENRDKKTGLNAQGKAAVQWLFRDSALPPNVLLSLDAQTLAAVFAPKSGQAKLNEMFRRVTNRRIGRATIAAVAQQKDYMKRVRSNGGSRTALAPEGYIIPGGDYEPHKRIAQALGVDVPMDGEFVSIRLVETAPGALNAVQLDGRWWRAAAPGETPTTPAPSLPDTRKKKGN